MIDIEDTTKDDAVVEDSKEKETNKKNSIYLIKTFI